VETIQVSIKVSLGSKTKEMLVLAFPTPNEHLAIHANTTNTELWMITHIPSGHAIIACPSLQEAVDVVSQIVKAGIDTSRSAEELQESYELREIVKRSRQTGKGDQT